MSFHSKRPHVISGASDNLICEWDVGQVTSGSLAPLRVYKSHNNAVNDVQWHHFYHYIFVSCDESNFLTM